MAFHGFDESTARRIVAQTKKGERDPGTPLGGGGVGRVDSNAGGFWAIITDQSTDDLQRYSWEKLIIALGKLTEQTNEDLLLDSGEYFSARSYSKSTCVVTGTIVWLEFVGYEGEGEEREPRYIFADPPSRYVTVKITSTASGGGKYLGVTVIGTSDEVASGTLSLPSAGRTITGGENVLFCNVWESGLSEHNVAANSFGCGHVVGKQSDGRLVVEGNAFSTYLCPDEEEA